MRGFFTPLMVIFLATAIFFALVFCFYDRTKENEALCVDQEGRWDEKTQSCGLEPQLGRL